MAATSVLISVGTLVVSFIVGIITYFLTSQESIDVRKKNIEEVSSFIVNVIIFIWIGKILLNINLFIQDPLAVLAYPSYSSAFYIGLIGAVLVFVRRMKKGLVDLAPFLNSLMVIFIFTSFTYEFVDYVWNDNLYTWRYLTLLFGITMIYIMISNKVSYYLTSGLLMVLWGLGQTILSILLPFTTVFGYLISIWFFIIISIIGIVLLLTRKQVKAWQKQQT
ncbi:hypothetical protein [Piscibacillus salipiscarius]|uniref:Uncharacterized protein n=1 Tax=Piscibacillus salipiscarius TaxID=299480 RepID=A0ABW5Q9N4_9BACI|nr:hypothetical protein [Piscibacillus salipiscarius]